MECIWGGKTKIILFLNLRKNEKSREAAGAGAEPPQSWDQIEKKKFEKFKIKKNNKI